MAFVVVARERECAPEEPDRGLGARDSPTERRSCVGNFSRRQFSRVERAKRAHSIARDARTKHRTPTMFRKTLIFATVLLAFAATHAEDAPKITHKVRDAAHFEATRSRVEDSTSGRLHRRVRRQLLGFSVNSAARKTSDAKNVSPKRVPKGD
jgi:hypothetical protein